MRIRQTPAIKQRLSAAAFFCATLSALAMGPACAQTAPATTHADFGSTLYPKGWTQCANEGQTCWFPGAVMRDVVFGGSNGTYLVLRSMKDYVECTQDWFYKSDPQKGAGKSCWVSNDLAMRDRLFTPCAIEGGTCTFTGTKNVWFGGDGRYSGLKSATNSIACTQAVFGDPFNGHWKACYVSR